PPAHERLVAPRKRARNRPDVVDRHHGVRPSGYDAREEPGMNETRNSAKAFTDDERAAMKERAREQKSGPRSKVDAEGELLAKIAEMAAPDRAMAKRLHAIVKASAPELAPRLWYGMPAYAKAGKVVCFFQ